MDQKENCQEGKTIQYHTTQKREEWREKGCREQKEPEEQKKKKQNNKKN